MYKTSEWLIDFTVTTILVNSSVFYLSFGLQALPACKLIHLLTIPSDVSRWRVKRILKIEQKVGKKNHTTCLLW